MPYQSLDENGNFIAVNQAFLAVLGYTRAEVVGRNFGEFLAPEWRDHFKQNFPRFKAVGEILGVEFEMVKKDGSRVLVSFNGKIALTATADSSRPTASSPTSRSADGRKRRWSRARHG